MRNDSRRKAASTRAVVLERAARMTEVGRAPASGSADGIDAGRELAARGASTRRRRRPRDPRRARGGPSAAPVAASSASRTARTAAGRSDLKAAPPSTSERRRGRSAGRTRAARTEPSRAREPRSCGLPDRGRSARARRAHSRATRAGASGRRGAANAGGRASPRDRRAVRPAGERREQKGSVGGGAKHGAHPCSRRALSGGAKNHDVEGAPGRRASRICDS